MESATCDLFVAREALDGALIINLTISFLSMTASPKTETFMFFEVSPGMKVSVPAVMAA